MRHLGSLIAGLLLAPAAWLLLAIGQPRTASIFAEWLDQRKYDTTDLLGPIGYLAAAGLLLGLVASLRLSPVGPGVAGAVYAAGYGVLLVNPLWGIDQIPNRIDLGFVDASPRVPVTNGTLAVVAFCLLTAVLSGKRWRRWPAPALTTTGVTGVAGPAGGDGDGVEPGQGGPTSPTSQITAEPPTSPVLSQPTQPSQPTRPTPPAGPAPAGQPAVAGPALRSGQSVILGQSTESPPPLPSRADAPASRPAIPIADRDTPAPTATPATADQPRTADGEDGQPPASPWSGPPQPRRG